MVMGGLHCTLSKKKKAHGSLALAVAAAARRRSCPGCSVSDKTGNKTRGLKTHVTRDTNQIQRERTLMGARVERKGLKSVKTDGTIS